MEIKLNFGVLIVLGVDGIGALIILLCERLHKVNVARV